MLTKQQIIDKINTSPLQRGKIWWGNDLESGKQVVERFRKMGFTIESFFETLKARTETIGGGYFRNGNLSGFTTLGSKDYFDSKKEVLFTLDELIGEEPSETITVGSRVIRGKDWRWDNQDKNGPGVVVEVSRPFNSMETPQWGKGFWYRVRWDSVPAVASYRVGEKIQDLQLLNTGRLLGYEIPQDLFGGAIKAGELATKVSDKAYTASGIALPRELVEYWKPVYEVTSKEFYIGDNRMLVLVNRDSITAEGRNIPVDELRNLIFPKNTTGWILTVRSATYDIGCTKNVEHEDLVSILKFYDSVQ